VIESAVTYARRRFGGPVALCGSSLGGILSWYALTREPDVEAVVCHNIAHPAIPHEPAARIKIPMLKRLARAAPLAGVPIKQIANFDVVADSPELRDYFHREEDRIWSWKLTARGMASFFTYRPPLDWSAARTRAMVLVGESDRMVTRAFTEQVLATARPPAAELRVLEGAGHMLFMDELDRSLPVVVEWLRGALATEATAARATAA
jgi:pimeloyl-ACP methyl ester carboxylesterase